MASCDVTYDATCVKQNACASFATFTFAPYLCSASLFAESGETQDAFPLVVYVLAMSLCNMAPERGNQRWNNTLWYMFSACSDKVMFSLTSARLPFYGYYSTMKILLRYFLKINELRVEQTDVGLTTLNKH